MADEAYATQVGHRDRLPATSRYELVVKIASGGMATVYAGRLSAAEGVHRVVAIKRAHAHLLEDPAFRKMLIVEARLAARIHHPNVVSVHDVEEHEGELLLVMDYVEGAALSELLSKRKTEERPLPGRMAVRVLLDACAGLQAAHTLDDDDGKPLGLVHRDVSPHNILVGLDGVARLADFGIAKAGGNPTSLGATATGALKGKVAYMAPEYIEAGTVDPRIDVFALGVVAWESLTRKRLFHRQSELDTLKAVLSAPVPPPSEVAPWLGTALDAVVMRALERTPDARFQSARDFAEALERAALRDDLVASHAQVGDHVRSVVGAGLEQRRVLLRPRPKTGGASTAAAEPAPREPSPSLAPTLPDEAEQPRTATMPISSLAADVEKSTLGSGVSARLVSELRDTDSVRKGRTERQRIARIVAASLAITFAGVGVFALGALRAKKQAATEVGGQTSPPTEPRPTPTNAIATNAVAPTNVASIEAPSTLSTKPTTTFPSVTASNAKPVVAASATAAPMHIATPKPGSTPTFTTKPPKLAPPPTSSPPPPAVASTPSPTAGTSDKAPPNPYAPP